MNKHDTFFVLLPHIFLLLLMPTAHAQDFPLPLSGDLLAYTDQTNDAIYLYDFQTDTTRPLQMGMGLHHVWDFSPDGCRLLYTLTDNTRTTRLYSAALDGTDARELIDTTELPLGPWNLWEPDWNPTQPLIAFTLTRPTEQGRETRVAYVPATGGTPTFYSVAGDEHAPRWSPDGAWLAYLSYEPRPAGATLFATVEPAAEETAPTLREADLWMVSADANTKERLTRFSVGSVGQPRWSPDGSLLSFVYAPSANDHQFWMIAAAPDAIPTQLSYEWNYTLDLAWQPDGTALTAATRYLQGTEDAQLWRVPLAGNADVDATRFFEATALAQTSADFPRYSADGERLAFRASYELVIVDLETNAATRLGTYGNTPPVWSPAGFAGEEACA